MKSEAFVESSEMIHRIGTGYGSGGSHSVERKRVIDRVRKQGRERYKRNQQRNREKCEERQRTYPM